MKAFITACQKMIDSNVAWVQRNWKKLLAEKDLQAHYKATYFWACVGDAGKLGFYRDLIARKYLRSDGDFRTFEDNKGWKHFRPSPLNRYIYANGWIICGMQRAGAYDIARKGMDFILRFQDPRHGGFYSTMDEKTKKIDKSKMNSSSTSSAGLACLATGRLEEAKAAGDFLLALIRNQPQFDKYFFTLVATKTGRIATDIFSGENQWDPSSRKQICLSAVDDMIQELLWLIGKPMKFLAKLYRTTGVRKYLDGAVKLVDFFDRLPKEKWQNMSGSKILWACADLYSATGERRFRDIALRVGKMYIDTQLKSGAWVHTLWYKKESDQHFTWTSDMVHEIGGEYSDAVQELSMMITPRG